MSFSRIAIDATDGVRMRAASALLADHRVDHIGLIGREPPSAWGTRVSSVSSANGWDLVVGLPPVGRQADVTVGEGGSVSGAGPSGLTRALGAQLGGTVALAGTLPGEPERDGPRFGFPAPLGWLHGSETDGIHGCPVQGSLAGVMAVRPDGASAAIVDDREFLDGCALAAGVLLALEGHAGPVWEAPGRYLELVTDLGLVIAERSS